jgi:SAM-dependent MidA family methyltransferase
MTVAAFMDFALYDPACGYYARAVRRSGRTGDFFTSVDVGPLFGELLEIQLAEMAAILGRDTPFDLVEVGASDGRLAADILEAARQRDPAFYSRLRVHLVEASEAARAAERAALSPFEGRLASTSAALPRSFSGALMANEWLDALPVHQVVMRREGLREVYVDVDPSGRLLAREDHPSTPELAAYLDALGVSLEPGWRAEIGLDAVAWIREAARRLDRGFLILIDYGHEAKDLYSVGHAGGTLTTFSGHTSGDAGRPGAPPWLAAPGTRDITAHVDFTSVRRAAEAEGLVTLGFLDQTYFLLGLLDPALPAGRARALKTLVMPGGLGSTMKVLLLGKGVGAPALSGCSFRVRAT